MAALLALPNPATTPLWSTAACAKGLNPHACDTSALREHLVLCQATHGQLVVLHCIAQSLHGFITARVAKLSEDPKDSLATLN